MKYPTLRSPILKNYQNNRRTVYVNQLFGENLVPFYKNSGLKGHAALDLKTKGVLRFIYHNVKGFVSKKRISKKRDSGLIPIQATHAGRVSYAGEDSGGGRSVRILSDDLLVEERKAKIETLYYHLDSWRVQKGQKIRAGHIIGNAGNSGKWTTGAHLHFGVKIHWKVGDVYQADYGNGYNGYVDPMPFMADGTNYQRGYIISRWFQFGKERFKKDLINIDQFPNGVFDPNYLKYEKRNNKKSS